jgi:predicted GNAT family acetyltransferase
LAPAQRSRRFHIKEKKMTANIRRFPSASEFLSVAGPFLLRNEAYNNLIFGLAATLEVAPRFSGDEEPYLAVAFDGADVAGAGMTPPRAVVLSLCDNDAAVESLAQDVLAFRRTAAGVTGPLPGPQRFAEAWQRLTGDDFVVQIAERCYKLERLIPPSDVRGTARLATEADLQVLTDWRMAFTAEAVPHEASSREDVEWYTRQRFAAAPERVGTFLWEVDGQLVSMASYGGPTPNGLRIGGVYTPPEFRRRGYASACTAASCEFILASGRSFATLFTDLTSPTSNRIYQAIGFEPVCDAVQYGFIRAS